jgi:hypothetical protein
MSVQVIAHTSQHGELLGPDARKLIERTTYLKPVGRTELARTAWSLAWRQPFLFMRVFLYVLGSRYDIRKSQGLDKQVFARAVCVAGVLRAKRADHVHVPWASMDAFVAMLAARLLGIPYTVQARAYDIHRHTSAAGLPTKLAGAAFVITNSKYNEAKLRSVLPPGSGDKVCVIYNGVELSRFQPRKKVRCSSTPITAHGLQYLAGAALCGCLRSHRRQGCERDELLHRASEIAQEA